MAVEVSQTTRSTLPRDGRIHASRITHHASRSRSVQSLVAAREPPPALVSSVCAQPSFSTRAALIWFKIFGIDTATSIRQTNSGEYLLNMLLVWDS